MSSTSGDDEEAVAAGVSMCGIDGIEGVLGVLLCPRLRADDACEPAVSSCASFLVSSMDCDSNCAFLSAASCTFSTALVSARVRRVRSASRKRMRLRIADMSADSSMPPDPAAPAPAPAPAPALTAPAPLCLVAEEGREEDGVGLVILDSSAAAVAVCGR